MKHIALTIKQLWELKIVFNSIFNALEKKEDGNYYIDNKKNLSFTQRQRVPFTFTNKW